MFCVYVLLSKKDNKLYTGQTKDLSKRLSEHNSGRVKSTRNRRPFELIHSEIYPTRNKARWRERYLKSAWGKKKLKERLELP